MTESESAILLGWNAHKIRAGGGVRIKLTYGLTCFYLFQCNCIKSKISGNIIEKYAILRKKRTREPFISKEVIVCQKM